jgi:hypothetical protein
MCLFPPFGGNAEGKGGLHAARERNSHYLKFKIQNVLVSSLWGKCRRQRANTRSTRAKSQNQIQIQNSEAKMCLFPPFGGNAEGKGGIHAARERNLKTKVKIQKLKCACFLPLASDDPPRRREECTEMPKFAERSRSIHVAREQKF